jgi:pimeloyl-ACP methyl ester carboxylesterase
VAWGPCDPDDYPTLGVDIPGIGEAGDSLLPPNRECAEYDVPLDYTSRDRRTVTLELIRRPADDPAAKRGTIFVNPGGPGGSGVETVASAGDVLFGPEVLARFDVVGFDPRGIAGSDPLQCYPDNEALLADLASDRFQRIWPETPREYRDAIRDAVDLARDCARKDPLLDNMGTSTVAKDLDVLRRAVGDTRLTFVGYSYGTYVCAQYHAQYPDRVGALVCDANIDPVEYATGEPRSQGFFVPNLARARTEVGANATLEEFFRLCDEAAAEDLTAGADLQRCAFGPDSAARFRALYTALDAEPLDLGVRFDEQSLIGTTLGPLYGSIGGFAALGGLLAELEALVEAGGELPPPVEEPVEEPEIVVPPVNEAYLNIEGFYGVSCSDNRQPDFFGAWALAIRRSEGYFGPLWSSGDFDCGAWPGVDEDTVLGPFTNRTPNPVLVVNALFDPATPYEDAVAHAERLPNSALLTIEGWGHVGQGLSACGDAIIDEYVLTRRVPSRSMTCSQDITPFDPILFEDPAAAGREFATPGGPAGDGSAEGEAPVVEEAVDAAFTELAEGTDPEEAGAAAADTATGTAITVVDRRDPELADRLRARQAVLRQTFAGILPAGVVTSP